MRYANKPPNDLTVESSITIQKDSVSVFNYVADLRLDRNWRKEINETVLDAQPGLNTIATESSFLSKKVPAHVAKLQCIEYMPGKSVVYKNLPANPFSLKNSRRLEAMADGSTRLVYNIAFDPAIVKHGLGFSLPLFVVKWYTAKTMNDYLRKLKLILESAN